MFRTQIYNFYRSPTIKNFVRNIAETSSRFETLMKHAYYQKTLTKNELLQHLKDNVVYESDEYIATSVPAGLPFKKNKTWLDTVSPLVAEVDFNDILDDLPSIFNTDYAWLTKYPRRNASGIVIFSKSQNSYRILNHRLNYASSEQAYVYTFLVMVLGCPPETYSRVFGIKSVQVGHKYGTEILLTYNPKKTPKCYYKHEVLASSDLVSLVKVDMSNDDRDCIRHILASVCLTPILGDYWNYKKRKLSVLGVPMLISPDVVSDTSVELEPELLEKLDLHAGEEKFIPIHSHLHSVKAALKHQQMLAVSVPPPDCFVWTCNRFGFNAINDFIPA